MAESAEIVRMASLDLALRDSFLRWQCRIRQMMMRENQGRPNEGVLPDIYLPEATEPLGAVITVLSKAPEFSKTMEMQHMVRKTRDPALRREAALKFFSEIYYQKGREFSDMLTATFAPGSQGAEAIREAGYCRLEFSAFNQKYTLKCKVWALGETSPLWQSTYWHNLLFNPSLPAQTTILGFEPDWSQCTADPSPIRASGD